MDDSQDISLVRFWLTLCLLSYPPNSTSLLETSWLLSMSSKELRVLVSVQVYEQMPLKCHHGHLETLRQPSSTSGQGPRVLLSSSKLTQFDFLLCCVSLPPSPSSPI